MALMHPQFDPVALSLGPVAIHWYGLMYLAAFAQFLLLGRLRVKQAHWQSLGMNYQALEDLLFKGVLGVIVGGRLGYVLFLHARALSQSPAGYSQSMGRRYVFSWWFFRGLSCFVVGG